ncbi:hypothetical protein Scep_028907 [Stephania cephalantha]|uniref:Uncharacterized protein n=1 Tax=Stephania cephalantha TaxID=152367 RepID=A0AAP0ECW5_9MAGN
MDNEKLEISSPRGVLDICVVSIESESDSSKVSTLILKLNPLFAKSSRNVMGSVDSSAMIPPDQSTNLCYLKSSWRNFTFAKLHAATKSENLLGKGDYGEVYKQVFARRATSSN